MSPKRKLEKDGASAKRRKKDEDEDDDDDDTDCQEDEKADEKTDAKKVIPEGYDFTQNGYISDQDQKDILSKIATLRQRILEQNHVGVLDHDLHEHRWIAEDRYDEFDQRYEQLDDYVQSQPRYLAITKGNQVGRWMSLAFTYSAQRLLIHKLLPLGVGMKELAGTMEFYWFSEMNNLITKWQGNDVHAGAFLRPIIQGFCKIWCKLYPLDSKLSPYQRAAHLIIRELDGSNERYYHISYVSKIISSLCQSWRTVGHNIIRLEKDNGFFRITPSKHIAAILECGHIRIHWRELLEYNQSGAYSRDYPRLRLLLPFTDFDTGMRDGSTALALANFVTAVPSEVGRTQYDLQEAIQICCQVVETIFQQHRENNRSVVNTNDWVIPLDSVDKKPSRYQPSLKELFLYPKTCSWFWPILLYCIQPGIHFQSYQKHLILELRAQYRDQVQGQIQSLTTVFQNHLTWPATLTPIIGDYLFPGANDVLVGPIPQLWETDRTYYPGDIVYWYPRKYFSAFSSSASSSSSSSESPTTLYSTEKQQTGTDPLTDLDHIWWVCKDRSRDDYLF